MKLYLTLLILILFTSNCSLNKVEKKHGVPFLEKKNEKLAINKSNKNDIIKVLGAPSTESVLEDDLWIYIENRKSKTSLIKLGKEIVLTSNILVLEIDKKGILKNKKFYNIDDQNKINFNDDKTKISDKNSFIFSVMSSLKHKIDNPKRNK